MMVSHQKVYLITKPVQSGKTFEILKKIIEIKVGTIVIIFVDNSLLQTTQLKTRI
jgi:hypothetical protein